MTYTTKCIASYTLVAGNLECILAIIGRQYLIARLQAIFENFLTSNTDHLHPAGK
jgi:hypothetical protein